MSLREISVQRNKKERVGRLERMHQKVGIGIAMGLKLDQVGAKSEGEIRHDVVRPPCS